MTRKLPQQLVGTVTGAFVDKLDTLVTMSTKDSTLATRCWLTTSFKIVTYRTVFTHDKTLAEPRIVVTRITLVNLTLRQQTGSFKLLGTKVTRCVGPCFTTPVTTFATQYTLAFFER